MWVISVGPPSNVALGHLDGGGAAAGREQRREGSSGGMGRRVVRRGRRKPSYLWMEKRRGRGGGDEINANGEAERAMGKRSRRFIPGQLPGSHLPVRCSHHHVLARQNVTSHFFMGKSHTFVFPSKDMWRKNMEQKL